MNAIETLLLKPENLYLMGGVWVLLDALKRLFPKLSGNPVFVRVSPLLPLVLCCAGVWIPGVAEVGTAAGERILVGLILGYTVAHTNKIVMQGVMGRDARLQTGKPEDAAAEAPADVTKGDAP